MPRYGYPSRTEGTVAVLADGPLIASLSQAFDGLGNLVALPSDTFPASHDIDRDPQGAGPLRAAVVEAVLPASGAAADGLVPADELRCVRTVARRARGVARTLVRQRRGALVCVIRLASAVGPNQLVSESLSGFVRCAAAELSQYGVSLWGVLVAGVDARPTAPALVAAAQLVRILTDPAAAVAPGEVYVVTDAELGRLAPPAVERELLRADRRLRTSDVAEALVGGLDGPRSAAARGPGGAPVSLAGRVAIVTGGGGGIGRAVAAGLAAEGAAVVVADLGCDADGNGSDPGPAEETAAGITGRGGRALAVCADISRTEECHELVDRAVRAFGRVDALCHAAGVVRQSLAFEATDEDWDAVLGVHVAGAQHLVEACLGPMGRQAHGRIVLFSSRSVAGSPGLSTYSAAKGAVLALGRSLADRVADSGIRANVVFPSGRTRASLPDASSARRRRIELLRARHHGITDPVAYRTSAQQDPDNNVAMIGWLCGDQADAVNGRIFGTGGWHVDLHRPSAMARSVPLPPRLTADDLRALSADLLGSF